MVQSADNDVASAYGNFPSDTSKADTAKTFTTVVYAESNGDGVADVAVALIGVKTLAQSDFGSAAKPASAAVAADLAASAVAVSKAVASGTRRVATTTAL